MDWVEIGKYAGTALGSFFTGSIASGYFTYKLEYWKELRQKRRELVAEWRKLIDMENVGRVGFASSRYPFMDDPAFHSLYPHLSEEFKKPLFSEAIYLYQGPKVFPRDYLRDEIARIEKVWGLI